jgi:RNA polymerase subunit RPABC4/transcription elongation factor Spt4
MALLKCPECGGNVSSTVHTCIHCGYEFNVCPTCQAVVIKSASSCPSCGATIEDDPKNASIAEEVEESSTADHSEYETETKKKEFPPIAELLKKTKKPFGYYLFRTFNITAYER